MRPSAGTPYFARVPETPVSPRAPQDRDQATGIASPLRTPEPKADAANHATHQHLQRSDQHRVRRLSGSSACRKRHRTTLGGTERRAGIAAAYLEAAGDMRLSCGPARVVMPGAARDSEASRDTSPRDTSPAGLIRSGHQAACQHGGATKEATMHQNHPAPEKQPQKEATRT